jgi:fructose-1,6-bisphosphatase/inositol monophosphatase family enzyme
VKELLASAQKGEGTYLNGQRLQLTTPLFLHDARIIVTPDQVPQLQALKYELSQQNSAQPSISSAIGNTFAVLQGTVDGYVACDYNPWDYVPPVLLLEEAGLTTTQLNGEPIIYKQHGSGFMSALPSVYPALKQQYDILRT